MRRPTPALAISCLALFVALGGTAIAAHDYLITSKSQISPKVLKALRGARGPAGPTGATGAPGVAGKAGAPGKNGTNGTNGVDGKEGKPGADGSARAWAYVASGGTFGLSKNVGTVERRFKGVYCVTFGSGAQITPNNSAVLAFPVYTGHPVFMQYEPGANNECEIANAFAIEAHTTSGELENTSFFVMVP
jgi:hypothetical protein